MSRRTYPVPNKNLSGSDYIQNKRAKQLFSGTSNLAKTIEEQNGNFPLLTPQGKLKPYQGTYGLSGRSVGNNKSYCLNTSHSYRDLLAITKGKYLITPPNISNSSTIKFNDVSDAKKLYNGVYYVYSYNSSNLLAFMNPGYPDPSANYVPNQIKYAPLTDTSQRIIVDPSYIITYSSQSCILHPSVGNNIKINNDIDSRYSFNRTINLDLLAGFQYPVKFELDYDTGDCINTNNDIQTKYSFPVPPIPPFQLSNLVAGGVGTNQAILAWSEDGVTWNPSDNGNTIFKSQVAGVKFNTTDTWLAVGGNSTDPSGNVIAYSIDGVSWTKSVTSNPAKNANNLLISGRGVEWVSSINKWIVVGQPKTILTPSAVSPSIIFSSSPSSVTDWDIASSTDPSLNNPFGVNGIGFALATNNASNVVNRIILAVGTGEKLDASPINMVKSSDGKSWTIVNFTYFNNSSPPYSVTYAETTISPPKWLVGGASGGSPATSPIYYSTDTINWLPGVPLLGSGGSNTGTCYDIACRGDDPSLQSQKYVAVGSNLFGLSNIVYSDDGVNWTASNTWSQFQPRSVSWINFFNLFIGWFIVGNAGSGIDVSGYSTDGINWDISPNGNGIFVNGALSVGSTFGN
jgi:hypothetical protein